MQANLSIVLDQVAKDKNIEREVLVQTLEQAILAAAKKVFGLHREIEARFNEATGVVDLFLVVLVAETVVTPGRDITVEDAHKVDDGAQPGDELLFQIFYREEDMELAAEEERKHGRMLDLHDTVKHFGRIAAQTAKQVMLQKTRERERTSIFDDFTERTGSIVTGTVVRAEGGNLLVNVGRTEGFLPRSEQIPGETHQVGERIRVLILDVREQPNQIKVILSRSHPNFIARLFELEVPEVAERTIEIKALAREAGYRTKVAVSSIDSKVDAVGACVGVRGSRIKNIVEELGGEKIDIVRWNESSQILIQNALKPAEVQEIALCFELNKATVVVAEDQLSLAIGKRGQNVRLAARLTGWNIDILTPGEYNKNLELLDKTVKSVEGVDDLLLDKLVAIGCVSVSDVDAVESEPLVRDLEITADVAERIVEACGEEVIRIEEEKEHIAKLKAAGLWVPPPPPAPAGEFKPEGEVAASTDESGEAAAETSAEGAEAAASGDAEHAASVPEQDGQTPTQSV